MNAPEYSFILPIIDEYLGDDLTQEDLHMGYSAFLQDQGTETSGPAPMEM